MKTSQEALILLAAVTGGQFPPGTVPASHWPDVIGQAVRHGVAPVLLRCIRSSGFDLPNIDISSLKEAARLSATRYVILESAQAQIEAALREAGLPTIWLKGIALSQTLYPDPALRPMSDLDVLVPYDRREDALEVAKLQGYRFPDSPGRFLDTNDGLLMNRVSHHYHLVGGPAQMVTLELHSRLLGISNDILSLEDIGWFWEQTSPCRTASIVFSTLNPTAHLLYLCAHAELQHAELYLLRYLDLHLLVTHTPIDWPLLIRRAAALRWTSVVESALRASMKLFGTPVSEDIFVQLRALRPVSEDTTRIEALKARGSRWVRVRRLLASLTLTERFRVVLEILFPSCSYMRSRYAIAATRPTWPYYLYRWLDQAREVFYATKQRWMYRRHNPNMP
ncbi:MAG: nucleotidyltransferase family protein [Anaerolineae bacterium]|nr:nucleotidyltransferase family protein [Anaerolineae bacterium]